MSIIDRIRDFLNDRPIQSDSTGLFIERQDLREIVAHSEGVSCQHCEETVRLLKRARQFSTEAIPDALSYTVDQTTNRVKPCPMKCDGYGCTRYEGASYFVVCGNCGMRGPIGRNISEAHYQWDALPRHPIKSTHATQEQYRPEVRGI